MYAFLSNINIAIFYVRKFCISVFRFLQYFTDGNVISRDAWLIDFHELVGTVSNIDGLKIVRIRNWGITREIA